VLTQLEASKIHFDNCATLAAVLYTTFTENLRLCFSAEAGIMILKPTPEIPEQAQ